MPRHGDCWDNAAQESFFGHFKDEAYIKTCETLGNLKKLSNICFTIRNIDINGIKKDDSCSIQKSSS